MVVGTPVMLQKPFTQATSELVPDLDRSKSTWDPVDDDQHWFSFSAPSPSILPEKKGCFVGKYESSSSCIINIITARKLGRSSGHVVPFPRNVLAIIHENLLKDTSQLTFPVWRETYVTVRTVVCTSEKSDRDTAPVE
jgi:hypothetical protein